MRERRLRWFRQMKDTYLLPFILTNVFEIAKSLNQQEFKPVLNKLQPLFGLRDPPQNMLSELCEARAVVKKLIKYSIIGTPFSLRREDESSHLP